MKKLLLELIITCISISNIDNVNAMDTEYNEQDNAETEVLTSIEYKNAFYEQIKNVVKKYHDVTIMTKALYKELQNCPEAKLKVPHDGNHLWTDIAGALIIIKVLHQIIQNNINNKTIDACKQPICICEIKLPILLMLRINSEITENITLYFDKDSKLFIGNNNNINTWQPAMLAQHAKLSKFAKYKPQILSKEEHAQNLHRMQEIIKNSDQEAEDIIDKLACTLYIPSKEQVLEAWKKVPQKTDKNEKERDDIIAQFINKCKDSLFNFLNELKEISGMSHNNFNEDIIRFQKLLQNLTFNDINYVILKSSQPMEQLLNEIKNSSILSYDNKLSIVHLLIAFYNYQIKYSQFWPVDKWNLFAQQIMDQLHAEYIKIHDMIKKTQYDIIGTRPIKIISNNNNDINQDDWTIEGEYTWDY